MCQCLWANFWVHLWIYHYGCCLGYFSPSACCLHLFPPTWYCALVVRWEVCCLESLDVNWKCVESLLCQVSLRLPKKKKKSQMGWVQHYFQENNAMCIIFGPFLIFSFSLSEVPFLFIIPTPPPVNTSHYFKTQSVVYTSAKSYLPVPAPLVQYSAFTSLSSLHSVKIAVTAPWTLHCTLHLFRYSPLPSSLSTPVEKECISLLLIFASLALCWGGY